MATMVCIMNINPKFLFLYIIQITSHIFEYYNLFCITLHFILLDIITFYFKRSRNLAFISLSSTILGVILNDHELRVLFVYKSQPIDQNFYFISYLIAILLWYAILKKVWNLKIN